MKKILSAIGLAIATSSGAYDLDAFNATRTNAVLAIAGREFELLPNERIKIRDASGLVTWLTEDGTPVTVQDLDEESGERGEAILCADDSGNPVLFLTSFPGEWARQWEWYVGGFSLGMSLFIFAYQRRMASKLIGGGDHGE